MTDSMSSTQLGLREVNILPGPGFGGLRPITRPNKGKGNRNICLLPM